MVGVALLLDPRSGVMERVQFRGPCCGAISKAAIVSRRRPDAVGHKTGPAGLLNRWGPV
jgi:hypothetical protein